MESKYNLLKDAFSIKNATGCVYDTLHGYVSDFSENGNVDGWDIYSNLCLYGVWDTVLFGTSLDRECYISRSNIFIPIPAENYHTFKITLKLTVPEDLPDCFVPTKGRLMWQTVADPSWDDEKSIDFDLIVNDQWYTYIVNTGVSQYWQGDINNVRIYPFIDGKPDIRVTIKTINIDSTDCYKCGNTQCDFYMKYSHPCAGEGVCSSITSGEPKDLYSVESGVSDSLIVNIDGYGNEKVNLGTFTNITGYDMAKVLVNRISLVNIGQYAYVEATYDETTKKITIFSGSATEDTTIKVSGPAAQVLGFTNYLDEDISSHTTGKSPASGFDYVASRRLKGFEINALIDSDTEHTAYYHNPNQFAVEAGRADFTDSMSSCYSPRSIDVEYYKELDGNNKLIIDGSHPINDSGRLTIIKVNGTRCKDSDKDIFSSSRFVSSFSKVVLLRPHKSDDIEDFFVSVIYEAFIPDLDPAVISTVDDVTYSIDVNWLVNKGDMLGFYNFNVLAPFSLNQQTANAVFFMVAGSPSGKFSIGKPISKGVVGISFYARGNRIQENIELDIDLGKRVNIEELFVYGKELKTDYEYNVAACLDVNWEVDLHNETHWHAVDHCIFGYASCHVEHRNKCYGKECLDDCVRTPDNGQQGDTYVSNPIGGTYTYDGTKRIRNDDPDTYSGLVTIGKHSYFYVNGDDEWLNGGCSPPNPVDIDADYWKMEFKSPWLAGEAYDYEFDPITFTLFFPQGRKVDIHKSGMYFKESNNFKHLSLSYYLGEFGGVGNAEEMNWQYIDPFNYVILDGTTLTRDSASGSKSSTQYEDVYFANPWPWAKPEYVNGVCVNWDIYQTIMNERMNTLEHHFDPIECYGFRYHTAWHKSTKITELEVYSSLYIEPSLLDNISITSSVYSDEWVELSFTADEINDEKIQAHVTGSPRYFKLSLKSQDIFKLKELNAKISEEHLKSLECVDTVSADLAPQGIITIPKALVIENTYDVPLNLIIDIPTVLFKQEDILSWIKFDSTDSTLNAEIGPGATVMKNEDYPLFLDNGQVANNCYSYYLKNLIDNKASYVFTNEFKWFFYKTLYDNIDVDYSNVPIGKHFRIDFKKVSSKYWKFGIYDEKVYSISSFFIFNGLTLVDDFNVYIQAETGPGSGKFKTSIDSITGDILPVSVVEDNFSNNTYIDYWDYELGPDGSNNNFIETGANLIPYLDPWGTIYIRKSFLPGIISFSLQVNFKFDLPNKVKYSVDLLDENERVLFVMELIGNGDSTFFLHIYCPYPVEQDEKAKHYSSSTVPLQFNYSNFVKTDFKALVFNVVKEASTFKSISLETEDGESILYTGTELLAFPDRVSTLRIQYENLTSEGYYIQTDRISTSYVNLKALPFLSSREFIAFDFTNSEPIDAIVLVHSQNTLEKPVVFISNLDKDDYVFWARNCSRSDDLASPNLSIYSSIDWNYTNTAIYNTKSWHSFTDGYGFKFTSTDAWVRYDFGCGNAQAINYIYYEPRSEYHDHNIIEIYGSNVWRSDFNSSLSENEYLTSFSIDVDGSVNNYEVNFVNNKPYRFIIIYWLQVGDSIGTTYLYDKIKLCREFSDFNPYASIPNEQEVLLLHSNFNDSVSTIIDSSYYTNNINNLKTYHSSAQKKFGDTSLYFNGVAHLYLDDDVLFDFADNDFTIDVWVYLIDFNSSRRIFSTITAGITGGLLVSVNTTGGISVESYGVWSFRTVKTIDVGKWVHIALVGYEGVIKCYIDGVADTNTHTQDVLVAPTSPLWIGRIINQSYYNFYGYMDAYRVNNGRALWTTDFEPPIDLSFDINSVLEVTENNYVNYLAIDLEQHHNLDLLRNCGPKDDLYNLWASNEIDFSASDTSDINLVAWTGSAPNLLLNFIDFTDSSLSEHQLLVNGSVVISTVDSPVLPNGHAVFNGGYISIENSVDFNFHDEEFTIDFRVYRDELGYEGLMGIATSLTVNSSFSFMFDVDGYLVATLYSGTGLFELKSLSPLSVSIWYHIALIRSNNTIALYINGDVHSSTYFSNSILLNQSSSNFIIGRVGDFYFTGQLDELRIIKGNAYWRHNFTPPEEAYTFAVVGDKNDARWVRIPLLCGDGTTRNLQYLGIYPDITMAYLPSGGLNCEWTPFDNYNLSNYGIGRRNIAPYSTVLNITEAIYNFEDTGLLGWSNLSYPVEVAAGAITTIFDGSFPDPIWESYSIDFTNGYSSVTHEDNSMRINLASAESGGCSFRTRDIVGDCSFEIEVSYILNSTINTGRRNDFLRMYSSDGTELLELQRLVPAPGAPLLIFRDSDNDVHFTSFSVDDIKEINKFKIKRQGTDFYVSYYNKLSDEWIYFTDSNPNSTLDFVLHDVYFEYSISNYNDTPADLVTLTYASLIIDSEVVSGNADWGLTTLTSGNDCLVYLTPEVMTDYGPILAPESLITGRPIQYFAFQYYSDGLGGGGISILDSNDEEILAVGCNFSNWFIKSASGWKLVNDSPESGNASWYGVNITFDWITYKVLIEWYDVAASSSKSFSVELIKQTNVCRFQIRSMLGTSWGLNYQNIKFDNIRIVPQSYWIKDWNPYECLSGDHDLEELNNCWVFPSSVENPTLILDLGDTFSIDKFVLYHTINSNDSSWLNQDYTISAATSVSGTYFDVVSVTDNSKSYVTHTLTDPVVCSHIKLEITKYIQPEIAPIYIIGTQGAEDEYLTVDGGVLREFEIWQVDANSSVSSQEHPIVCINLRDQFNLINHSVVCPDYWPFKKSWSNDNEFFQFSDDPTDNPNKVSFASAEEALTPFYYSGQLLDVNKTGGPLILTSSVFLIRGNYKITWKSYGASVYNLITIKVLGAETYSFTSTIRSDDWAQQNNDINILSSGYYSIQASVNIKDLTDVWGLQEVVFRNIQETSKWVSLRRITAEGFTYDSAVGAGIDYLTRIKVYSSDSLRPTEFSWWWEAGLSTLENEVINTKVGTRSLKINYPDSYRLDYVKFLEGDRFGLDTNFSIKDSLSMWLYISDINKLDVDNGGIAFGCFESYTSDTVVTDDLYDTGLETHTKIDRAVYSWDFKDLSLKTGWNLIKLQFDKYSSIYPEASVVTGALSECLNYRYHETVSFGMVFRGKGSAFYMLLDDIRIERNYFYDEVIYNEKGLCLTWNEFAEIPLSGASVRRGTIEMWVKLYSNTQGQDNFGDIASRTLFTLVNNNNETLSLSIRGSSWFEVGFGNTKSFFTSLFADADIVDLSNYTFSIGESVHLALVWSSDGIEMSNTDTTRLYVNGTKCLFSTTTWDVSDNKGTILRLGGGNSYLSTNDNDDGSAIFSNVKVYNYCKEEFDLNERMPKIINASSANNFLQLSPDNVNFYNNSAVEVPLKFKAVQPGDKVTVYTRIDKTEPDLIDKYTGTVTVDWEIPV